MPTITPPPDMLLKLYLEHVRKNIESDLRKEMAKVTEPMIRAAAEEAMSSLQVALRDNYKAMSTDLVLHITTSAKP